MHKIIIRLKDIEHIREIGKKNIVVQITKSGDPGKTPIKGVDYFTIEDKTELIRDIQFDAGIEPITESEINIIF